MKGAATDMPDLTPPRHIPILPIHPPTLQCGVAAPKMAHRAGEPVRQGLSERPPGLRVTERSGDLTHCERTSSPKVDQIGARSATWPTIASRLVGHGRPGHT